jgi:DNA-binding PadR family transcriptional regulator
MQETGIKSGSLYPILGRFEQLGWIVGRTEPSRDGRPPRRLYEFRADATADARAALDRYLDASDVAAGERVNWGLA